MLRPPRDGLEKEVLTISHQNNLLLLALAQLEKVYMSHCKYLVNMAGKSPHVSSKYQLLVSLSSHQPGFVATDILEKVQVSYNKYAVLLPQPRLENTMTFVKKRLA